MNNYDFHTLDSKDFEILSVDLLQKEFNITFEIFKPGKDEGIDFRYIDKKGLVVCQSKHWLGTGIDKLINHLLNKELPKVKELNPYRYIFTTSLGLSPKNKKKIKEIFKPYIISESDIFGKDDLNNLLGKFPDIEHKHFKLWISSANILNKIINNGVSGRSEFSKSEIERNIRLYVITENDNKIEYILNQEKFLLITGEPGIGKTTLARFSIYRLLKQDFKLIEINNIKDAEDLWNENEKQVFYWDDFLGSTHLSFFNNNQDTHLIKFINRIKSSTNKRFIITSRTIILNQAINFSQNFTDTHFNISKYEVEVKGYNRLNKAEILYNHLYFNEIPKDFYDKIKENKNYFKIIDHKNFNPRIIEFVTNMIRLKDVNIDDYFNFIFNNLNNPSEIWKYPFENQTDVYSKFFLMTLFSLDKSSEEILEKSFDARLGYEITNNGFSRPNNIFNIKVKELLGAFINRSIVKKLSKEDYTEYNFFNPSIIDFISNYLKDNDSEKWRIINSVIFAEQLTTRFNKDVLKFSDTEMKRLYEIVKEKESIIEFLEENQKEFNLLNLYYDLFDMDFVESDIIRLLNKINWFVVPKRYFSKIILFLEYSYYYERIRDVVVKNWEDIMENMFKSFESEKDLGKIMELFVLYDKNYKEYIKVPHNKELVQLCIKSYWESRIDNIENKNEEVEDFFTEREIIQYLGELNEEVVEINSKFEIDINIKDKINEIDIDSIISYNSDRNMNDDDYYLDSIREDDFFYNKGIEENNIIVDMFENYKKEN